MPNRTKRVRFLVGVASTSYSYAPGDEVDAGALGQIEIEEAARYVSSGAAEWVAVRQKIETATKEAPERATARRGARQRKP